MDEKIRLEERFRALSPRAQKQVLDFLAFLEKYENRWGAALETKKPISAYPFVGLWREREDMRDSRRWVRETRQREWQG